MKNGLPTVANKRRSPIGKKGCYIEHNMTISNTTKSTEDMILALAGQFKQLPHEPEKFRSWVRIPLSHLNFSGS